MTLLADVDHGYHVVHIYESERVLARCVLSFFTPGLLHDQACLVVATPEHLTLFANALAASGVDLDVLRATGRYVELDAETTLAGFVRDGRVDAQAFEATVGRRVHELTEEHGRVHIYGEMVACLWGRGDADDAIELEHLWNGLAQRYPFRLCCAYAKDLLATGDAEAMMGTHSHIDP